MIFRRLFSSRSSYLDSIRNLGIIAHIDAGKTTTTERMLFHSGLTKRIGEVHRGDTIMDYLPQERERGITIVSAAITFPWKNHRINLIDTPGHVDFTVEVERSMRVLDGAVTILDSSAGVEAQTLTVWEQAVRYEIPRIVFANKMDHVGANPEKCLQDVSTKLKTTPLTLQWPIFKDDTFVGIFDVLSNSFLEWKDAKGTVIDTTTFALFQAQYPVYKDRISAIKDEFILSLAEINSKLLEIGSDTEWERNRSTFIASIKDGVLHKTFAPVLFGAAYKNIGIQPLLDAIVDYLPSPAEKEGPRAVPIPAVLYNVNKKPQTPSNINSVITIKPNPNEKLVALAFKVIYDDKKGIIVFVRVYSGTLSYSSSTLYNVNRNSKEKVSKLYQIQADEMVEVSEVKAGNICALVGPKNTSTGDTLTNDFDKCRVVLDGISIPPAVFYCSVEADSPSDEVVLCEALRLIQLEDPSFHVVNDENTSQLLIAGMGRLHLEIIQDKIISFYKVKCGFGNVRIAFKETLLIQNHQQQQQLTQSLDIEKVYGSKKLVAGLTISISPLPEDAEGLLTQTLRIETDPTIDLQTIPLETVEQIKDGIISVCNRGVLLGAPLHSLKLVINDIRMPNGEFSAIAFQMCAMQLITKILNEHKTSVVEPMMKLNVTVSDHYFGVVLNDLTSSRRALISHIHQPVDASDGVDNKSEIVGLVPLMEIVDYADILRSISAGTGSFYSRMAGYKILPSNIQSKVKAEFMGE